jgi:riboflavin biosynthesis pyrimidine reductase
MGFSSLLVEGGNTIFSQFIFSDLADEIKLFVVPMIWGHGLSSFGENSKLPKIYSLQKVERSGQDILVTYRKRFYSI